jgi:hypothetical protein
MGAFARAALKQPGVGQRLEAATLGMRACLVLLLLACNPPVHAQPMLKCKDAQGQITYSNVRCEDQGLRQIGEVQDRVTVLPKPAAGAPPARAREKPPAEAPAGAAEQRKPVNPPIEKPGQ